MATNELGRKPIIARKSGARIAAVMKRWRNISSLQLLACFSKPALALGIAIQSKLKGWGIKVWPEGIGKIQFGISRLPEHKVTDAEFASGTDE